MMELWSLFKENGLDMTVEECAEMFSVVTDIKNAYLISEFEKKNKYKFTNKQYKQKEKMGLQLSMEDFQIVTSKSRKALLKLQNDLMKVRSKMRANNNESFVPVTVDELMYQFCTSEKRKETKT